MKIDNFDQEIQEGVTLVDFYATWCGPCKMLSPVLEQVEQELVGVKFIKVDVDENPNLSEQYRIMSVPTLILFKDGNIVEKKTGFMPKDQLINWIDTASTKTL